MRSFVLLLTALIGVEAFVSSSVSPRGASTQVFGYVPDGFTAKEWKALKEKEAKEKQARNLGRLGPNGFKSRSFQSFHEALERGEAKHLMPVFNAEEKVKRGEIKREDIPYMQRVRDIRSVTKRLGMSIHALLTKKFYFIFLQQGGSWDSSDVKGAKRLKWSKSDKEYASGGFKKEQSVSIFGIGEGLDWTGTRGRSGPESVVGAAPKFAKNYKPPNVNDDDGKKKKFFGLF